MEPASLDVRGWMACTAASTVMVLGPAVALAHPPGVHDDPVEVMASLSHGHAHSHAEPEPAASAAEAPFFLADEPTKGPWQAESFAFFEPFVRTRSDGTWLWIESDGLTHPPAAHVMMAGIRRWQQQVPLPQPYTGTNAWQVPLKPELADVPVDGRKYLRRGAVAIAVNGIPIFNALTNRGDDAFLAGELDEFGGHSGRGDDYHYHTAPFELHKVVGYKRPIGFALDGFPLYGIFDPKAKPGSDLACPHGSTEPLDELNGHFCTVPNGQGIDGGTRGYHYHASKGYPYINGGLRGKVKMEDDQVIPQPRAQGVREALPPLSGASITGFKQTGPKAWSLSYTIGGKVSRVDYSVGEGGAVEFRFVAPDGSVRVENYTAGRRGGGQGGGRRGGGGQGGGRGGEPQAPSGVPAVSKPVPGFTVQSSSIGADGVLPARFTCDGESIQPSFAWKGVPKGTTSIAFALHHAPAGTSPGGDEHAYMVIWDIPVDATGIAEAQRDLGTWGANSMNRRAEYAPPCSQGGGMKTYVGTVYALKSAPKLTAGSANFAEFLKAVAPVTIGTADVNLSYARTGGGEAGQPQGGQRGRGGNAEGPGGGGQRGQGGGGGQGGRAQGGLLAQMTAFKTEVPAHDLDLILLRPTRTSITVAATAAAARNAAVEYWQAGTSRKRTTEWQAMKPGESAFFVLDGLAPGTEWTYRLLWRTGASGEPTAEPECTFHTPRQAGTPFSFTIQADSHLDQGVDPAAYERTLLNMRDSKSDFMVDLGDTFMVDKRGADFERSAAQYDAQRYWFGLACRSMPLFMVLGNHDGERGGDGGRDAKMPGWSHAMRTARFPAPEIGEKSGGLYTGRTTPESGKGGNYYAFEWGDALFVALDPFWSTTDRIRGAAGRGAQGGGGGGKDPSAPGRDEPLKPVDGSWTSTLGREQYDWLERTLAGSKARHRFVFIHHLVGGMGGSEARGGVESAPFFEWGGKNADGSDGFAEHRPGWPMPIHPLLVKHGVSAVFHGHDHLYVHGQLDGIHYQCVPQPGNIAGGTRSAAHYGYASGTIMGSPGHVRVRVDADEAKVEFVRTAIAGGRSGRARRGEGDASADGANGAIVDSYVIRRAPSVSPGAMRGESPQDAKPRQGGGGRQRKGPPQDGIVKPAMSDTVHGAAYADNWFAMYVNGKLVAIDSIDFLPHNVVSLDILPQYPMTIAVLAKDNADPKTGCEYGTQIGDGGFILKFADGTVTDARWKAKCFMHGPVDRKVENPSVRTEPLPDGWERPGFDDSSWPNAVEYSQERIDPKQPFFEHDFKGAKWIWTGDLDLDNTVILRTTIEKAGWKPRWSTKPDLQVASPAPTWTK